MAKKQVSKKTDDSKLFAFLATFLSIIGFIIALVAKKEDRYVMFYAKQSLVIFIAYVLAWVISMILFIIPVIGFLIMRVLYILLAILWIISWLYALSGQERKVPVIGKYADNFNF